MNAATPISDLANDSNAAGIGITVLFPCVCRCCGSTVMRKRKGRSGACPSCLRAIRSKNGNGKGAQNLAAGRESVAMLQRRNESLRKSQKLKNACRRIARDFLDKRIESMLKNPKCAKGIDNHKSKHWKLKSPERVVYEFKNLTQFIRDNSHLFDPDDIKPKPNSKKDGDCNARGGLASLRPSNKSVRGAWKGWTWVSILERDLMGGRDIFGDEAGSGER